MKQIILAVIIVTTILACNSNNTTKTNAYTATRESTITSATPTVDSTTYIAFAHKVVAALASKDYAQLTALSDSATPITLSPYGYIDTATAMQLMPAVMVDLLGKPMHKQLYWGNQDGSGSKIYLKIADYFNQYVYNVNFKDSSTTTYNASISKGNSKNNIAEVFTASKYIEYYKAGTNPKYDGMDWNALRIVIGLKHNKPYLQAIVHDQWTS